ncbi:MAG: cysteine desulfurase family protein [Candidatus Nanopelagicales bacterium]
MAYLDHAATTPVRPAASAAWHSAPFGNAASVHGAGRAARRVLEEARESVAESLGVSAAEVVFTPGGTAADNLAITGIHRARRLADPARDVVVISTVEHPAVTATADALVARGEAARVVRLPVTAQGFVDLVAAEGCLEAHADRVSLLSVMSANNEVGAVQPVAELAALATGRGVPLHTDAAQSAGWWGLPGAPGAAATISGHKFGAPVGIGALVLPSRMPCEPWQHGGGQERQLQSGTVPVGSALALAKALAEALGSGEASGEPGVTVEELRDELVLAVQAAAPTARLVTPPPAADRPTALPGIAAFVFPGCPADALLMLLDAAGVYCSTGSACSAGIPRPSAVLTAMGDPDAGSMLRFSLGWTSTRADLGALAAALPSAVDRARRAGRL